MPSIARLLVVLAACGAPRSEPPPGAEHVMMPAGDAATATAARLAQTSSRDAGVLGAATDAATRPPPAGWVDLAVAIPDAVIDLRYATAHNVTGVVLYPVARCWLRAGPAARLVEAAASLRAAGHRLVLWDCYRPASIQRALWQRMPDPRFVARPGDDGDGAPVAGSVHSRGAAVDVSLADQAGTLRAMPTDHDDFGAAASGGTATGDARAWNATLRAVMISAGFRPLASEWWHFDAGGGTVYPLVDLPLE